MNETSRQAWFAYIRTNWSDNLMSGYAKTCYPSTQRIEEIHQEWNNG